MIAIVKLMQRKLRYKQLAETKTWEDITPILQSIDDKIVSEVEKIKDNYNEEYLKRAERIDAQVAQILLGTDRVKY